MNPRCLGDGPLRTVLWSGIDRTLPAPATARTGCSRPRTWPLQSTQADEAFPDHRRAALVVRAVQSSGDASKHRVIVPWPIHSSFSHSFEVRRRDVPCGKRSRLVCPGARSLRERPVRHPPRRTHRVERRSACFRRLSSGRPAYRQPVRPAARRPFQYQYCWDTTPAPLRREVSHCAAEAVGT